MKKIISLAFLIILVFAISSCTKDQLYSHDNIQDELLSIYNDTHATIMEVVNMEGFSNATDAELQQLLSQKTIFGLYRLSNEKETVAVSQSFRDMIFQISDKNKDIVCASIINNNSYPNNEKRMLIMYLACSDVVYKSVPSLSLHKSAEPCNDAYLEALRNICENFIIAGGAAVLTGNLLGLAVVTVVTYKALDEAEEAYEKCLENQ